MAEETIGNNNMAFLKGIILGVVIIPLAINLWKLFFLRYSIPDVLCNFIYDVPVMIVFIFVGMTNPMRLPLVYNGLFALFALSFLLTNTPSGLLGWGATLLVLGGLYFVFPFLYKLNFLVIAALLLSYIIVRIVLPLEYHREAVEVLGKKSAYITGKYFVMKLSDHRNYGLAREKFIYYAEPSGSIPFLKDPLMKLHHQIMRFEDAHRIQLILWDHLVADNLKGTEKEELFEYKGKIPVILKDEKSVQPWMVKTTSYEFSSLPLVMMRAEPFVLKLVKKADGTYRVKEAPEKIVLEFERQ